MGFSMSAALDVAAISEKFATQGYASIAGFLTTDSARQVRDALREFKDWNLVFNDRGRHIDLSAARVRTMPPDTLDQLHRAIYAQAAQDFQYFYYNYPIYDAHRARRNRDHVLHRFYEWVDSEAFLGFARAVTGLGDISFADAQATRYEPGHFLTVHDDTLEGKNRRAAYVFNFSEAWRPDWGGYLQLLDDDGRIRSGLLPSFNTLNLIAIPQPHNVSLVAPFAGAARLSITGWLRYGEYQK